jgi:hypothetical protein
MIITLNLLMLLLTGLPELSTLPGVDSVSVAVKAQEVFSVDSRIGLNATLARHRPTIAEKHCSRPARVRNKARVLVVLPARPQTSRRCCTRQRPHHATPITVPCHHYANTPHQLAPREAVKFTFVPRRPHSRGVGRLGKQLCWIGYAICNLNS